MGGRDVFCAICGVKAGHVLVGDDDGVDDDEDNSGLALSRAEVEWTNDVRVICENEGWMGEDKVYITGRAIYDDLQCFYVEPGSDPSFPPGTTYLSTYESGGSENRKAYPFHAACLELLTKCLGVESLEREVGKGAEGGGDVWHSSSSASGKKPPAPPPLDRMVLYETLKSLGGGVCLGDIRYPPAVQDKMEQYFWAEAGDEALVSKPTDVPRLKAYYDALPLLADRDHDVVTPRNHEPPSDVSPPSATSSSAEDPFAHLAVELILDVLNRLPMSSVNALGSASRAVASVLLTNHFWRRRIIADMPWLYDIPFLHNHQQLDTATGATAMSGAVDWERVYRDLLKASSQKASPKTEDEEEEMDVEMGKERGKEKEKAKAKAKDRDSNSRILGLVSRRRTWAVCERLKALYMRNKARKDSWEREGAMPPQALRWAAMGPMPAVTFPPEREVDVVNLALIRDVDEHAVRVELEVGWTAMVAAAADEEDDDSGNGVGERLASLRVIRSPVRVESVGHVDLGGSRFSIIGSPELAKRVDRVVLPDDDWIAGAILFTREVVAAAVVVGDDDNNGPDSRWRQQQRRDIIGLRIVLGQQKDHLVDTGCCDQIGDDARLLQPTGYKGIVGLSASVSRQTGLPLGLGLLTQPMGDFGGSAYERVSKAMARWAVDEAPRFTWKAPLPPFTKIIQGPVIGNVWTFGLDEGRGEGEDEDENAVHEMPVPDQSTWRTLVFGADEDELADLVCIAADVRLGAFEVRYTAASGRPRRRIGPCGDRDAVMKVLDVDGPGGERISKVFLAVAEVPLRLRFCTNRGRQLVVCAGSTEREEVKKEPGEIEFPLQNPDVVGPGMTRGLRMVEHHLRGIFCWWEPVRQGVGGLVHGIDDGDTPRLAGVGVLAQHVSLVWAGTKAPYYDLPKEFRPRDAHGCFWEPNSPSEAASASGTRPLRRFGCIWGGTERGNAAAWLDCGISINEIEVAVLEGGSSIGSARLLGLAVRYSAEQQHASVGPTLPLVGDGELADFPPRYTRDSWSVGGKKLVAVRTWLAPDRQLSGVQFVAEGGITSPKWGLCEGPEAGVVYFGERSDGEPPAVGLKFFFGTLCPGHVYSGAVIKGVQAMREIREHELEAADADGNVDADADDVWEDDNRDKSDGRPEPFDMRDYEGELKFGDFFETLKARGHLW